MRTIGIALFLAWITLEMTLSAINQMRPELEDSPILGIPEVKKQNDRWKKTVANPTPLRIALWTKWSALFLLVTFGLWTAYAVIGRHHHAMTLMLIGALLFLGRRAIFNPESYERMFTGVERIPWYLENGYYQYAVSFVWYIWILPLFFLFLTVFSCLHLVRKRLGGVSLSSH